MTTTRSSNPFDFSRPLDVHRWSEHPDADRFVDEVYAAHFKDKHSKIERKHLSVVLLDLYVAWLEHPDLKIAVSMRPAAYKAKRNRYNKLHISARQSMWSRSWLGLASLK